MSQLLMKTIQKLTCPHNRRAVCDEHTRFEGYANRDAAQFPSPPHSAGTPRGRWELTAKLHADFHKTERHKVKSLQKNCLEESSALDALQCTF